MEAQGVDEQALMSFLTDFNRAAAEPPPPPPPRPGAPRRREGPVAMPVPQFADPVGEEGEWPDEELPPPAPPPPVWPPPPQPATAAPGPGSPGRLSTQQTDLRSNSGARRLFRRSRG